MASLMTADGRVLRRTAPAGAISPFSNAMSMSSFAPLWSTGDQSDDDHDANVLVSYEQIYRTQPTLAAAVNKLVRAVGALPLDVYRRLDSNEREQVFDHPLGKLLESPCPRQGPSFCCSRRLQ